MLRDSQGRRFEYLRLSVTEACNFRCVYCLPEGCAGRGGKAPPLSVPEIRNLVAGFAELGVWKVRLTGGEPTLRTDLVELARQVAGVPGIRKVAITTNGWNLTKLARPLRDAGVTALNVSVDSLDPERFLRATGKPGLAEV
ncbi:MAG: radical SAM protein, partial [Myxococcaceae bacterium]